MKYYALYNPNAGNGDSESRARAISDMFPEEVCYFDVTKHNYTELLSNIDTNDVIIICGGDGTLNRFINETEEIEIKNEILYYAIGTGNDFLKDIGKEVGCKPFSVNEYINDLPSVEIKGKSYRFLNNVGFGIDGYCCEVGDELKKTSDKPVNYTAIAIKGLLFHYKPTGATITVDGVEHKYKKVWLAPTMKGRYYGGGMMATPDQDRNDPEKKLSVMLFYGKGKLSTLMAFPSIFKGEHVKKTNMVAIHTGKEISVKFDQPRAVQIDGETILGVTEYKAYATSPAVIAK
jgi:diacylglycerol kinase family enzyme